MWPNGSSNGDSGPNRRNAPEINRQLVQRDTPLGNRGTGPGIVRQTESVPDKEKNVPMNEDERFQMQEGKIWALTRLLAAALDASGIRDAPLEALIAQARQDYPATCDPKHPVGIGFDEIVNHIRARGTTQSPTS